MSRLEMNIDAMMDEMEDRQEVIYREKLIKEREDNKTKVTNAEIVVNGTVGRPYFELKYTTLDGETHIGYSSYFLPNVFRWRDELFEIVK